MQDGPPWRRAAAAAGAITLLAALVASAWLKLTVEAGGPLWLDEGWTLGLVQPPTWGAFVEQLRLEVNPPLYFVLLRGWAAVFGTGDLALRAFSTACAVMLPAVALLPGGPTRPRDRATWAVLLALWAPGIVFAQEARGYALLAVLAAAQTVLFAHLLARPGRARAAAWAGAAALTALTQHHALLLTAAQGLALLAWERGRVWRLWPAALAFLPALVWDALQAPRIEWFARPEHAWYLPFDRSMATSALEVMVGAWPAALVTLVGAGAAAAAARRRRATGLDRRDAALWTAAAAAIAGGAALIALGALKPSLTPRYLAPFAPGALLVPVLLLGRAEGWARALARGAAGAAYAAAALAAAAGADNAGRRAYQFETASADLARAGATRLAFLWDNPTNAALAPVQRQALADAFFVRAGRRVQIDGVVLRPGEDPNARLAADPAPALLWLYDLRVPRTAARRFPPRLQDRAGLDCRRYAGGALGVVACVRSPLAWTR